MHLHRLTSFVVLLLARQLLMAATSHAGVTQDTHDIIPAPVHIEAGEGYFQLNAATRIHYDPTLKEGKKLTDYCRTELSKSTGFPLETHSMQKPADDENALIFSLAGSADELGKEGYALAVSPRNIRIKAADEAGWFYGFQTLRQLLPVQIYSATPVSNVEWKVPSVIVQDHPRFGWRGFMLDVSRNFFDKDTLKKLIDSLAMHKLNILHLHLTDYQAWRLKIEKYPALTSPGVTKARYYKGPYQTFLAKDDIHEIVNYAKARHITIVPEIDMPGHASAAITAYPEFGDGGGAFNPGKEGTYEFLEDVLTEVMDMFPAPYLHIGADEVQGRHHWAKLPEVKSLMKKHGFETYHEVEAYFDKRITDFIIKKGRIPCGWDEVSEFDVNREFVAFWWRSWKKGTLENAVKKGYRVVACPGSHAYFDFGQERGERGQPHATANSTRRVYNWEPVPDQFSEKGAKQILGVQANLWTPFVDSDRRLQYMIFPRISALAEVAWCPKGTRDDYAEFSKRVDRQIARYEQMGFYYRKNVENTRIGEWKPGKGKGGLEPVTVDVTPYIREAQTIGILFYLEKDLTAYDKIKTVELLENDQVISSSERLYFFSAEMFRNHVYTLDVKTYRKGATYSVRAVPKPGQHFDAVIYLRPFVQPETYQAVVRWKYWPSNIATLMNLNADQPLPPGENMLRNSSFEEDISAPFIDFWYMAYPDNAVLDDKVAKDGERSVCLKPTRYDRGITYKYVTNLEKEREYTFSIWAKAEKLDSLLLVYAGPQSSYPKGLCKQFKIGTDWQRLSWSFTIPADMEAERNRFQIGLMNPEFYYPEWDKGTLHKERSTRRGEGEEQIAVSPKGNIWLDAAQLEKGAEATPYVTTE